MAELIEDPDGAPYPESWQPQLRAIMTAERDSESIGVAVGAASSCWDNLEGAGVFQSDRAKAICDVLELRLGIH